jgi:hypothetical protein
VDATYVVLMFGLAFFAASRPPQADWLNDLSSMPPVSVTMQARIFLPEAAAFGVDDVPDGALPQAPSATTRLPAAIPAKSRTTCLACTTFPFPDTTPPAVPYGAR